MAYKLDAKTPAGPLAALSQSKEKPRLFNCLLKFATLFSVTTLG